MNKTIERHGLLLVLSSPSGAGKSTLSRRLLKEDPLFNLSISATTRGARPGETDGVDYFFISKQSFATMIDDGALLEHAEVFGNHYGTPKGPVESALKSGRDVLFDVDWQGAQQLRDSALGRSVVRIFILPPSIAALQSRLQGRAQDSKSVITDRMAKAMSEIIHWAEYDYVLINDDLDVCFSQIMTIVNAERLRRDRRPGLNGFVAGLDREFDSRKER